MYFAGWTTAALFVPRFSDLFGRKIVYRFAMFGHLAFYIAIVCSKSLTLTIILFYFFGFCSVGRASVGYLYMQELTP